MVFWGSVCEYEDHSRPARGFKCVVPAVWRKKIKPIPIMSKHNCCFRCSGFPLSYSQTTAAFVCITWCFCQTHQSSLSSCTEGRGCLQKPRHSCSWVVGLRHFFQPRPSLSPSLPLYLSLVPKQTSELVWFQQSAQKANNQHSVCLCVFMRQCRSPWHVTHCAV